MAFKIATGVVEFTTRGLAGVVGAFRRIGSSIAGFFRSSIFKIGGPLAAFFGGRAVLNETTKAVNAIAKLQAVLRATGNTTGFTTRQLADMAGELQKVTTFGDDATLEAQAVLATFGNIRGSAFERTLAIAQDMAALFEGDLTAAVQQLGAALDNPVDNLTRIRRQVPAVSAEFVKEITEMVQAGKGLEAQGKILSLLESRFKGIAQAVANTPVGKMQQMFNAIGDFAENIGIGFLQRVTSFFGEISAFMDRAAGVGRELGAALADILTTVGDLFALFTGNVSFNPKRIEDVIQAVRGFLVTIVPRIRIALLEIGIFIKNLVGAIGRIIVAAIKKIADLIDSILPGDQSVDLSVADKIFDTTEMERRADELRAIIAERLNNLPVVDINELVIDKETGARAPTQPINFATKAESGKDIAGALTDVGSFFKSMQEKLLGTADTKEAQLAQEQVRLQNEQLKVNEQQQAELEKASAHQADVLKTIRDLPRDLALQFVMR